MQFTRRDFKIANGFPGTSLPHLDPVGPEGGRASQAAERLLVVGKGTEEGAGKLDLAASPGSQPAGPVGHEGVVTRGAYTVTGLSDGLFINAEDEIGMRDLAAKLPFLDLRQIASVALVLDHLEGPARPATTDVAPDLAGHAAGCARRRAAAGIHRDRRAVAVDADQAIAVQISRFRLGWGGGVLRATLSGEPEDPAGVRMIIIGLQPRGELAIAGAPGCRMKVALREEMTAQKVALKAEHFARRLLYPPDFLKMEQALIQCRVEITQRFRKAFGVAGRQPDKRHHKAGKKGFDQACAHSAFRVPIGIAAHFIRVCLREPTNRQRRAVFAVAT